MKFKKGKSGNPGGRPKEDGDVKKLARKHTTEAVETLAKWMRSDNAKASVSASQALLDRGYGRPIQAIEGTGPEGSFVGKLTIEYVKPENPASR